MPREQNLDALRDSAQSQARPDATARSTPEQSGALLTLRDSKSNRLPGSDALDRSSVGLAKDLPGSASRERTAAQRDSKAGIWQQPVPGSTAPSRGNEKAPAATKASSAPAVRDNIESLREQYQQRSAERRLPGEPAASSGSLLSGRQATAPLRDSRAATTLPAARDGRGAGPSAGAVPMKATQPGTMSLYDRRTVTKGERTPIPQAPATPIIVQTGNFSPRRHGRTSTSITISGGSVSVALIHSSRACSPFYRAPIVYRPAYYYPWEYVYYHRPVYVQPVVIAPVISPYWYDYGYYSGWHGPYSSWSIGYTGRRWSIFFSDIWPSSYYTRTVYVDRPVIRERVVYEPAPVVRVVDTYDEIDRLVGQLKYGDAVARKEAAEALGRTGTLRALYPLLYTVENDEDPLVRFYAAKALGRLGDRDALVVLRRVSRKDAEEVVRIEAQDSVERILKG